MSAAKQKSRIWTAFVEYMHGIYYTGCLDQMNSETINWHYNEFASAVSF